MEKEQSKKKTSIGGQALIEGVMMRGPERTALAVRHTSGNINTDSWETSGQNRNRVLKLPFIRGTINFVETLKFGYSCLMKSVEMSGLEDEILDDTENKHENCYIADTKSNTNVENNVFLSSTIENEVKATTNNVDTIQPAATKAVKISRKKDDSKISKTFMNILMILSAAIGVVLAVVLFMWLPTFIGNLLSKPFPFLGKGLWRAFFEGVLKIFLFVGYVFAVSFMEDIKRVFMYHGAEHKTIFCYENGLELTVENVRKQSRFHPRCGTSFMIFMLLIGILVGIFIPVNPNWLRVLLKILTIPIVVSLGYELIKLAGRSDNIIVRILSAPGLWLQRITTKEPTDDMIEVAITAFEMVIPEEAGLDLI